MNQYHGSAEHLLEDEMARRADDLQARARADAERRAIPSGVTVCACGGEIGAERIAAVPATIRCIECAIAACSPRFKWR